VSSGTYVRALARDLGDRLGVGGHLTALRRTRSGPFTIAQAHSLDQMTGEIPLIPLNAAVASALGHCQVSDSDAVLVGHGRPVPAPESVTGTTGVFGPDGEVLAISTVTDGLLVPRVVFT
jgi:tRNA pseudouridine55 synthase